MYALAAPRTEAQSAQTRRGDNHVTCMKERLTLLAADHVCVSYTHHCEFVYSLISARNALRLRAINIEVVVENMAAISNGPAFQELFHGEVTRSVS